MENSTENQTDPKAEPSHNIQNTPTPNIQDNCRRGNNKKIARVRGSENLPWDLSTSYTNKNKSYAHEASVSWLTNESWTKINGANEHPKADGEKHTTRPQLYTDNYRHLRKAGSGRVCFPLGRAHQLVFNAKCCSVLVSPEYIHIILYGLNSLDLGMNVSINKHIFMLRWF